MTIQINRLIAANETQAATIARLERELDQAQVLANVRQDRWADAQQKLAAIETALCGLHSDGPVTCGIADSIEEIRAKLAEARDVSFGLAECARLRNELAAQGLELVAAKNTIGAIRATLTDRDSERQALVAYKAESEALRALAAWSAAESGRTVEWCCMDCEWQCWLGTGKDADVPVVGTGTTIAAAIMDALGPWERAK